MAITTITTTAVTITDLQRRLPLYDNYEAFVTKIARCVPPDMPCNCSERSIESFRAAHTFFIFRLLLPYRDKISWEETEQSILLPPFYMYIYQSIYTEYRVLAYSIDLRAASPSWTNKTDGGKKHIILQVQYASHYIPHSIVSRSCMLTEYHLAKFAELLLVHYIQDDRQIKPTGLYTSAVQQIKDNLANRVW